MTESDAFNLSTYPVCVDVDVSDPITILTRYVVPVLFGIVDIIGFSGNLLVIIVITGFATMRNSANILIVSLAMADLSFIIFCVPFTAMVYVTGNWPLPEMLCKLYLFTTYFSVYCSVYTLVLMCLDRFLAVVYPLQSRLWRTTRNTVITVIIMWIIVTSATLPISITSRIIYAIDMDNVTSCQRPICHNGWIFEVTPEGVVTGMNQYHSRIFYGVFFALGYAFPLTMICIFYSILLRELLCGRVSKMSKSVEAHRGKRKATKLVIVVVIVFAACWLPIQVVFMIQNFYKDIPTISFRFFHILGNILSYGNSCVNPILYAFFSDTFRMGFASLICLDKSKMRNVRLESNVGQSELMMSEQPSTKKSAITLPDDSPVVITASSDGHKKRGPPKEVLFVESVCVHPLTQYTSDIANNLVN
ncbi:Allatostatin-A receptor [Echinococcus granulosus]|uniref:Allatostatin A receptor n=1 Tax=Echinococcus granulosus TaxID=6210 RepID=A0A068WW83_ECHGR|nr:Allatostatin-A receptor [Echinococcus granulosus]CDS21891.1 allatostatin A receptor [Echinococcus granulosus]